MKFKIGDILIPYDTKDERRALVVDINKNKQYIINWLHYQDCVEDSTENVKMFSKHYPHIPGNNILELFFYSIKPKDKELYKILYEKV
jgi:hypothetical protein